MTVEPLTATEVFQSGDRRRTARRNGPESGWAKIFLPSILVGVMAFGPSTSALAQNAPQGAMKAMRIMTNFSLVYQTFFIFMNKFDGVFNGDYMIFLCLVDVIDKSG